MKTVKTMLINKMKVNNIPAIIWGKQSDKVYIHVHGKMSRKEYAQEFAAIAEEKGCQTISFDLPQHGERQNEEKRCDIWNGMHDLKMISDFSFAQWKEVSLYASSLGAYFSLNAYNTLDFKKCLFQSPILNMEYLIDQMMLWFDISQERLFAEKEIETPIDTIRWDYCQYIRSHPVTRWDIPTSILYGGKDNLQSPAVIREFAGRFSCKLTVAENSEHPFMAEEDHQIVLDWMQENI